MTTPPKMYSALAKGSNIEVFDIATGQRLYTLSLGSSFKATAGPYISGDILSVYLSDGSGNNYLKVFNVKTGSLKYTANA